MHSYFTGRKTGSGKTSPISPDANKSENRRSSISMDHVKRPSLPGLINKRASSRDKKDRSDSKDKQAKDARSPMQQKMVTLAMEMESPPVLLIGGPSNSIGAIVSGQLQITPNIPEATVESIMMYLECTTTTKRPVQDRCRECMSKITDLTEWKFFSKPKKYFAADGMQKLPFSYMVPGHLPATTHGHIGSIDYSLHVRAKTSDGQEVEFRRELIVRRALIPGNEKHSIRIFPPTSLQLQVTLPNVVYPIGEFPIQCKMTGIISRKDDVTTRWRLRKLTWRVEESETVISPACTKHGAKVGGEGKGVQHEYTREIGNEELKYGWKTDFDNDGAIEGEFNARIDSAKRPQCGMEAQNGLKILHNLVLELVIAEEWASNKKAQHVTPTGAARVLRTQFALNVTERAGMGLSWEDEMPPSYEDVPASPPHYPNSAAAVAGAATGATTGYTTIQEYHGDDIHEDVEHLSLNP